jgi:hypothetical protein
MTRAEPTPSGRAFAPALAMLAGIAVLAGYAVYLNRVYYAAHGPFYDSLAYMINLARVMEAARVDGFFSAVALGARGSTVFIPWLEAAFLGLFIQPQRELAVLVQLPLVVLLTVGAYLFFRRVGGYRPLVAVPFALAAVGFQAVFHYSGGLSDLRMDLSQALAFGAAVAFFSVARHTGERRYWMAFGVVLGISFLFRATTPVYAVLLFGGFAVLDARRHRAQWKRQVGSYLLAAGAALLLSIWFFALNFQSLYYYYFVWNYDANARLPLSASSGHLAFLVNQHLGRPMCLLMAAVLVSAFLRRPQAAGSPWRRLNWEVLLGGLVPVAFLVLFGAALNPYVSMVAAPALVMFALAPYAGAGLPPFGQVRAVACALAAVWVVLAGASRGFVSHTTIASPFATDMVALRDLTRAIHADVTARRRIGSTFEVSYSGGLDSMVIMNSLAFDQGFGISPGGTAVKAGMTLSPVQPGLANPVEWAALEGDTPEAKLAKLVTQARSNVDYLVVPENGTTFVPHHPITPYALAYRDMLLAGGGMTRIAGPLQVAPVEIVSVYRNEQRPSGPPP